MLLFLLYNLLFPVMALAFLAALVVSRRRKLLKTLPRELAERCGVYPSPSGRPLVWLHAASVGEARCLPKLVEGLKPAHLWLTTSTVAGKEAAASLPVERALLAPLDFYPLTRRCLSLARPSMLVIAETELWPSLLRSAKASGARVALVNGRLSERSARRYRWIRPLLGLERVDLACVQTEADRERFVALGLPADRVHVVGNLKHDLLPEDLSPSPEVMTRLAHAGWAEGDPVFVAGSTHPVEEDHILGAFVAARRELPRLRLVLAPRHIERLAEVERRLRELRLGFELWSGAGTADETPVLLVDRVGLLAAIYRAADAVFVGGTLVDRGGHNLMEPAALAKPTLFGPYLRNVADVAERLRASGGGIMVKDSLELKQALVGLLSSPDRLTAGARAREACLALGGATRKTLDLLRPLLPS